MAGDAGRKLQRAFGDVLHDRRIEAGLTQETVAERSALTRNYISDLERGLKSPSLASIAAIAQALETKPHLLVKAAEQRV